MRLDFEPGDSIFSSYELNTQECTDDVERGNIDAVPIMEKTDSWALDKLSHYGKVAAPDNYTHKYYSTDGENVVVYVGDSYIMKTADNSHCLTQIYTGVTSSNIIHATSLVNHATQVASLISGKKYGVAKSAEIVGVVMAEPTGLYYSNVIRSFYYVINDYKRRLKANDPCKINPRAILTLSITMPYKFWGFKQLYNKILSLGIPIVLSAGNQSKVPCDSPIYADPKVLVVGASTIDNTRAEFSNFGSCVNIYSPGENIRAIGVKDAQTISSGTSFAAPLVSGVLAAMISDPENSEMSVDEIVQRMLLCAEEYETPGADNGRIRLVNRAFECANGYRSGISTPPSRQARARTGLLP